jgi:hypothetical protein
MPQPSGAAGFGGRVEHGIGRGTPWDEGCSAWNMTAAARAAAYVDRLL